MNASRNRLLLGVALALAAVKFLLMPWIEAQSASRESLQVLSRRLDRSEGVIRNREDIRLAVKQIDASTRDARAIFPASPDAETFRLESQRQASAIATAAGGVSVKVFEWVLDGEAGDARLAFSRARLQLDGQFRQLVLAQSRLESQLPHVVLRQLNFVAPSPIDQPNESQSTLTLVIDFYYRPTRPTGKP